jgi:formate dehydrogenase subunit gamma
MRDRMPALRGRGAGRQGPSFRRGDRLALASFVLLISLAFVFPLIAYLCVSVDESMPAYSEVTNPRSAYWRTVREGGSGYSAVSAPEASVLIQSSGQIWRQIRNGPMAAFAPWVLGITLALIVVFHLVRGRVKVEAPLSGRKVRRWRLAERLLHWFVAVLFLLLAASGLSLFLGRAVLLPLLGSEAYAGYAGIALSLHNYLGPVFAAGLLLEIICWARHNIPKRIDLQWLRRGGGFIAGRHAPAGRMNGGEKLWFWFIASVGVGVCLSGLVLDFPNYGQPRETMQVANLVHVVLGVAWICVAMGHIYLGTIGTEGTLDGMLRGRVSEEWAHQHHDHWLAECHERSDGQPEPPVAGHKER